MTNRIRYEDIFDDDYKKQSNEEGEKLFDIIEQLNDPVSIILRCHLFIEYQMDKFLKNILPMGNKLTGFNFKSKLLFIQSFDFIDPQLIDSVSKLNDVRNNIAHEIDFKIRDATIDKIGRPLGKDYSNTIKNDLFSNYSEGSTVLDISGKLKVLLTWLIGQFTSSVLFHIKYSELSTDRI